MKSGEKAEIIMITPANKGRQCNCCYNDEIVFEIVLRSASNNQEKIVALCGNCLKLLGEMINAIEKIYCINK